MEVRLYDSKLSMNNKCEEMELVKVLAAIEMYRDLDFGGFIIVDGKSYRHCMYNREKEILGVEPVELNEEGEEIDYSSDFTCPYCGAVNHDAWELSDEGETQCGSCSSEIEYERVITIEYNIKPKKCAPVTEC
ncbi:hypothetical protein D3P07_11490 [Paenibacillus sp. 1011MAR3C5]|uniref:hypothetical protein n=1 Tax=Paenibacillus sp. 1011MAR3C5 TaxID=1675787 RepID=UPI000E6D5A53|nr:hypothetical protein [Paenibacillus sp. 1011MAR3C5]RJE88611.1 hypothetical protein D3P07_11490 [Paenibacillus sp. 1011MAR3C5]